MSKPRRTFSTEFKRDAASLVLDHERGGVTPKSKALTPEQQRIQELEARVNRREREKSILKKATALLMLDEFERTR